MSFRRGRADDAERRHQQKLAHYGLDEHPRERDMEELEVADRVAEQASLPPGDRRARALAAYRLGRAPSPFPDSRAAKAEAPTALYDDGSERPPATVAVVELSTEDATALIRFGDGCERTVPLTSLRRVA